ncbi:MAG: hypothetical protein KIS92_09270 [Planctomycetota bacterium]|nr:hypothetical protein [Planctomycetota bacterium]
MDDPEVLEHKSGGGCASLFGLPFLIMGLVAVFGALSALFTGKNPGGAAAGGVFGCIFSAIGGGIVFYRSGITLDKRAGTITDWWGLPFPLSRKESKLEQAREVTIKAETRRSKNSSYTVYVVRLEGVDMQLKFDEHRAYETSRNLAERVAKFANVRIHDYSGQGQSIREAGTLDESLQQRAERLGEVPAPPARMPDGCRVVHHVEGDEAVFDLPRPAPGCAILSVTAVAAAAIGALAFGNVPLIFFGIVMFVVACGAVPAALARERVRASSRRLLLERRLPLLVRRAEIPASELEELLERAGCVVARSDRRTLTFGSGLKAPERVWLKGVLTTILSARPQS